MVHGNIQGDRCGADDGTTRGRMTRVFGPRRVVMPDGPEKKRCDHYPLAHGG